MTTKQAKRQLKADQTAKTFKMDQLTWTRRVVLANTDLTMDQKRTLLSWADRKWGC